MRQIFKLIEEMGHRETFSIYRTFLDLTENKNALTAEYGHYAVQT